MAKCIKIYLSPTSAIFFLAMLLLPVHSYGQFNYSEGPHVVMNVAVPYETGDITCTVDSIRTVTVNWELIEISASTPAAWDFSICDEVCYPFFPTHGDGVFISDSAWLAGQSFNLKLGVSPNGVHGSGTLYYYLYAEDDPLNGDTVSYTINVDQLSLDEVADPVVKFAVDDQYLRLWSKEGRHTLQIATADGRFIHALEFGNHLEIELPEKGTYFLLIDNHYRYQIIM